MPKSQQKLQAKERGKWPNYRNTINLQKLTLKNSKSLIHMKKNLTILKMLNELKENTDRKLNVIRKMIHEQNTNINKEIEIIK